MADVNDLLSLYTEALGLQPDSIKPLPASGSNRKYYRIFGHVPMIGVIGTCHEENEAFIYLSRHLSSKCINVPKVLGVSSDKMAYIQEDLGDVSLFDFIGGSRSSGYYSESDMSILTATVRRLPDIQFAGAQGLDFGKCFPTAEMSDRAVMWDLNYFKYCFLKAVGIDFLEDKLEDDFLRLKDMVLSDKTDTFMYRDFQSRNVMIKDGQPWFIDFQGGRKGPFLYDVASFLWQAKANFPHAIRERLVDEYLDALGKYYPVNRQRLLDRLRHFVLFRTLQVLGAYGFRGYFERKPHFLQSIPYAIANLRDLLRRPFDEYPYLDNLLRQITELPSMNASRPSLTVKVISFSYKKGLPYDASGNGGGFVFDCRAVHNPGRYDEYKCFTGLDDSIKKFLEDDGEVLTFLESCYALVDMSVKRYIERGFASLMVCFGCTGGRHRSVYCAQHMAEHLAEKFRVKVVIEHREQDISTILNTDH